MVGIAALLTYGWVTSTRLIEMRLMKDGVPLSGLSLDVIGPSENSDWETFKIDQDGWVTLPSSYIEKIGNCGIKEKDKFVQEFVESGFDRGRSTVNFTASGIESQHIYRFLFYQELNENKSIGRTQPSR